VRAGVLLLALFLTQQLFAADLEQHLRDLRNPDPEVRIQALRELQTTLDPRIPDEMLRLLTDEGNSIRRLAARAIGSRWWQIPQERVAEFVSALQRNAGSEFEDEQNMVRRGVGLLTRDYSSDMFARSHNGRWVIYERHQLPCLIDTTTGTEELLGWAEGDAASLSPAWGNTPLAGAVVWHPRDEMVALEVLRGRKETVAWVWRHGTGLRELTTERVLKTLRVPEGDVMFHGGFYTTAKKWDGDELRLEASFDTSRRAVHTSHTVLLGWNPANLKLRVISHKKENQ
jgi:hypothetical protein